MLFACPTVVAGVRLAHGTMFAPSSVRLVCVIVPLDLVLRRHHGRCCYSRLAQLLATWVCLCWMNLGMVNLYHRPTRSYTRFMIHLPNPWGTTFILCLFLGGISCVSRPNILCTNLSFEALRCFLHLLIRRRILMHWLLLRLGNSLR